MPGISVGTARLATTTLGIVEAGVGIWVLSAKRPRLAATTQTALVIMMNVGGLAFARDAIPRPGRLIARNTAFLALVWALA